MDEYPIQADVEEVRGKGHRSFSFTKEEIGKRIVSTLLKGRWSKADLFLAEIDGKKVVLKDFSKKSIFIRMIGRLQIRREEKAYRVAQGIEGIPRFYGRPDPWSLVMDYVDGVRLSEYKGSVPFNKLLADLKGVIGAIHRAGVIHNDIRGRENIVVTREDDRLLLLDLAGAVIFKPGSLLHRIFFGFLKKVDEAAYLKWKDQLAPEEMSGSEKKFLKRFNFWRRFWFFNIKAG